MTHTSVGTEDRVEGLQPRAYLPGRGHATLHVLVEVSIGGYYIQFGQGLMNPRLF